MRKYKFLDVKRGRLMAEASCTACGIICLINDYAGSNMLTKAIDRTYNGMHAVTKRDWPLRLQKK